MPSKNIAAVLNNESNLHILERLKVKPYYPRELAAEMKVSEPFIVRRLKAMEEYGIVEGKWESEGSRKVKRYYPKDITMQVGKDGLEVTSGELQVTSKIEMKKEAIGYVLKLPLIVIALCGVFFNVPIIIAAIDICLAWAVANNVDFYRMYRLKTFILSLPLTMFGIIALSLILLEDFYIIHIRWVSPPVITAALVMALMIVIIYRSRFYQLEFDDMIRYNRELVSRLDHAPMYLKIFYLPMVAKWKLSEYLGLV